MRFPLIFLLLALPLMLGACDKPDSPKRTPVSEYKATGDLAKARAFYTDDNLDLAEAELVEILKKNPEDPYGHFYMGLVAFDRTQFETARMHFIRALELNPSSEFCKAVQELFLIDNSRVIGTDLRHWSTPALLSEDRAVLLAIGDDTDKDGAISPADNARLVHVNLGSRLTTTLLDATHLKGPAMPDPAGKKLVYASPRSDTNGDGYFNAMDNSAIFSYDFETREETILVPDNFHNADPSFSTDGKAVYFVSIRIDTNNDNVVDFNDNFAIYRYDLLTSETRKIVALPGDCRRPFATAGDSALLLWGVNEDTSGDGAIDSQDFGGVFRYDMRNPALEPVVKWRDAVGVFDFFVQGSKMAVVMNPDPGDGMDRELAETDKPDQFGYGIYFVDLITGKRKKVVTPTTERLSQPCIAPDGHTIAFQRSNDLQFTFICYYYDTDRPWLSAEELVKVLRTGF